MSERVSDVEQWIDFDRECEEGQNRDIYFHDGDVADDERGDDVDVSKSATDVGSD